MSLEIKAHNNKFQQGLDTLIENMWKPGVFVEDDVCVVAMLISLLSYGKRDECLIDEMVDYLLSHQQADGGWNCAISYSDTWKSSINTTVSVLEAFRDYEQFGYTSRLTNMKKQVRMGQDYLLDKHLFLRERDQMPITSYITQFHFPTRWKYDVLRGLLYFTSINYPYDKRMDKAIELLRGKMTKGYLTKGPSYSGRLHFQMEKTRVGRMNTLRGLMVLKYYDHETYKSLIKMPIKVKEK